MLLEILFRFELVLEQLSEVPHVLSRGGRGAILLHGVLQLVASADAAVEEAVLAQVVVNAPETLIPGQEITLISILIRENE